MTGPVAASHVFTLDPKRDYPTLVRGEGVYLSWWHAGCPIGYRARFRH